MKEGRKAWTRQMPLVLNIRTKDATPFRRNREETAQSSPSLTDDIDQTTLSSCCELGSVVDHAARLERNLI